MQPTDKFQPRDSNIASEDFDGEFVVLDLKSGKYFSLAGGAAIVWRGLMSGHSLQSLTAGLPENDARRAGAAGVLASLIEHDLVVPSAEPLEPDAALVAELAGSTAAFVVESYDDLAQLLIADPIHDVDEAAGWPHLPADKNA